MLFSIFQQEMRQSQKFYFLQNSRMMIFLQMKKDIELVFGKKAEIIQKWIERKAEIAKEFPGFDVFCLL